MRQKLCYKINQYANHKWKTHFLESESEKKFYKLAKSLKMKLKKQVVYGNYRIDFVYLNRVAIEIDGYYHKFTKQSDCKKTDYLERRYRVVRIKANCLYSKKGISRVIRILKMIKGLYK